MSRSRLGLFVAIALAAAAVCVRLGFWQLHRLDERRARNTLVRSRLDSTEVDIADIPRDTALVRFRRARVSGVPDYEHELVLASRTHNGSPGVYVITPVKIPGRDTAVIVNRGWVYAADGATIDLPKVRDTIPVFDGYAEVMPDSGGGSLTNRPHSITRLTMSTVAAAIPYPVARTYVVALGDSAPSADHPERIGVPPLDDGPHLSYAVQWFGFALIALAGAVIVVVKSRRDGGARDA